MKKITIIITIMLGSLFLTSCTGNSRARNFGGTQNIELKPGRELINTTWKEDDLWILTTTRSSDKSPSTYEFIESSSLGLMEGKIVIIEK